jgi:NitT/TauT family transport system substrate-binding protein
VRAGLRALVVASALVLGAGSDYPRIAGAQDQPVIHVAVSAFEAQAGVYYAQELGLFKRAGLNIEIQQLQGGEAIVAAIVSTAIQIGAGNPIPLANAHLRGIDVVLVAPGTINDNTMTPAVSGLIVATNSPLKTGKDFAGKTVSVNTLHSIDQIAMESWTDQTGGDAKTVRFVEVPNVTMADATADGRIDGAITADPGYSAGLAGGRVRALANVNAAIAKRFLITAWFATRSWADQHPDVARKYAAIMNDASAWAVKNPEAAAAVLGKYMRLQTARAHERHATTLDPVLLQPLIDAAARYKVIPAQFDVRDIIWH